MTIAATMGLIQFRRKIPPALRQPIGYVGCFGSLPGAM